MLRLRLGDCMATISNSDCSTRWITPLAQPYAAFSGSELITVAIENLIGRYLGGRVVNGISDAERARAEHTARQEVDKAITDYCAARPDRSDIQLCISPPDR